jgi:hypothetical protein
MLSADTVAASKRAQEALESVKSHGYKTGDGTIHLVVPKTCLKEEGAGWINSPY